MAQKVIAVVPEKSRTRCKVESVISAPTSQSRTIVNVPAKDSLYSSRTVSVIEVSDPLVASAKDVDAFRDLRTPDVKFDDLFGDRLKDRFKDTFLELKLRRRALEDIVHADSSYVDGRLMRMHRRIHVEYMRSTKPFSAPAFSEDELAIPFPRILYEDGKCFGHLAYLEFADDQYATDLTHYGKSVTVCKKGMLAQMCREQLCNRWVYRPCTDEDILDTEFVGRVSAQTLLEKKFADEPPTICDTDGHPFCVNDIKRTVCMFEFVYHNGSGFFVAVIVDRDRKVRRVEYEWSL